MLLLQDPISSMAQSTTNSAIKLAEAANDLGALKVIFGVFLAFIVVILCLFVYQFLSMNKKFNNMYGSIERVDDYFSSANSKTIGKSQANVLIRRSFNNISTIMKYQVLRIRTENNIQDRERVRKKVDLMVKNEYNELVNFLSNFICDGTPISDIIREDDIASVKNVIIEQIYVQKESFSVSMMDQTIDMYINGLKLVYLKKF